MKKIIYLVIKYTLAAEYRVEKYPYNVEITQWNKKSRNYIRSEVHNAWAKITENYEFLYPEYSFKVYIISYIIHHNRRRAKLVVNMYKDQMIERVFITIIENVMSKHSEATKCDNY